MTMGTSIWGANLTSNVKVTGNENDLLTNVAKRCVLEQKLLLRAYRKSRYKLAVL